MKWPKPSSVFSMLMENTSFLIGQAAGLIYEGCVTISSFRSWHTGLKRAPQRGYVTPHQNPVVSLSHTDTHKGLLRSARPASQQQTHCLSLVTQHLNPSLCDIDETWQSWPLHSRRTDSRAKQSSLLTQLFKQHHPMTPNPSVQQPHSYTANNQGSYLRKIQNSKAVGIARVSKGQVWSPFD